MYYISIQCCRFFPDHLIPSWNERGRKETPKICSSRQQAFTSSIDWYFACLLLPVGRWHGLVFVWAPVGLQRSTEQCNLRNHRHLVFLFLSFTTSSSAAMHRCITRACHSIRNCRARRIVLILTERETVRKRWGAKVTDILCKCFLWLWAARRRAWRADNRSA